jgi:hypothetical protein
MNPDHHLHRYALCDLNMIRALEATTTHSAIAVGEGAHIEFDDVAMHVMSFTLMSA